VILVSIVFYGNIYIDVSFKKVILGILLLIGCYVSVKLFRRLEFVDIGGKSVNYTVYCHLRYLKGRKSVDRELQTQFPEGYIFFNAIYLLTWCNLIDELPVDHPIFTEGRKEVAQAFENLMSKEAKSTYTESLNPKYGCFYTGWLSYCLARKLMIEKVKAPQEVYLLDSLSQQLVDAYDVSKCGILESYQGSAWSTDNIVAVTAVGLRDRVFDDQKNKVFIDQWLEEHIRIPVKNASLPFHSMDSDSCDSSTHRGCSSALSISILYEIDPVLSKACYHLFKEKFLDSRLLRYGFREYEKGVTKGLVDIDSGPIIWDIGAVSSIVGMKAASLHQDKEVFQSISNSLALFGFSYRMHGKERYLFGKMPIADLFIAWAHSDQ
jgi:hypothetical protein